MVGLDGYEPKTEGERLAAQVRGIEERLSNPTVSAKEKDSARKALERVQASIRALGPENRHRHF